ncbi:ferric uptake regulator, Fur family [Indibacter alkaliphilus LW1]|jgi:Fur family peroxide stress response transcriptional regulator|uniref:Ferric uptake regulator, Fur family n=1 Tax=Indibacter alkaliphilus (strain CCUG 57479 / KCTC 22604 / LW1) TaxID=1189612 RepID=S2DK10_INDAL|nr:transcriptional repressor [Indibacter alkaliphilus]EOZ92336.1 ferric uptake regulator, Fur family [Indibacter alkaliphilus LW1]
MDSEIIKTRITESGLKFTHQRWAIYDSLYQMEGHPTAEQVFEKITDANPSISLGTVYKTLDSFVQNGLIQKFMDQNGVMRFDAIIDAHCHIYCKDTHEIKDYRNEKLESAIQKIIAEQMIEDFEVDEISIVFKGRKSNKNFNQK